MRVLPGWLPATVSGKVLATGAGLVLAGAATLAATVTGGAGSADPPRPVAAHEAFQEDRHQGPGGRYAAAIARMSPAGIGRFSAQRTAGRAAPGGSVAYQAPLPLPLQVVRGFDPPSSPFGPGHLGVDLAVPPHTPIRSAGPGVVSFAGPVAGRGVVVVSHPDGVRTEYEPLRPLVSRGDVVRAGTPLGRLAGQHPGCSVTACLHWGARRGDVYIDPLGLLAPLGPVRLLPWDP